MIIKVQVPIAPEGRRLRREENGDADQQGTFGDFGLSEVQGRYLSQLGGGWIDLQALLASLSHQGRYPGHAYR